MMVQRVSNGLVAVPALHGLRRIVAIAIASNPGDLISHAIPTARPNRRTG